MLLLLRRQLKPDGVFHEAHIRIRLRCGFELWRDLRRDDDPADRNAVHLNQVLADPSHVAAHLAEHLVVAFVALQLDDYEAVRGLVPCKDVEVANVAAIRLPLDEGQVCPKSICDHCSMMRSSR